jgi:tetratricopeptide (TPR) repeat protein
LSSLSSQEFEKAQQLVLEGKYNKALQVVGTIEKRRKLSTKEQLNCKILKSSIFNKLGKYEKALGLAEIALQECRSRKNHLLGIDAVIEIAHSFWRLGEFDKSLSVLSDNDEFFTKLKQQKKSNLKYKEAIVLRLQGVVYHSKGELGKAQKLYKRSLDLWEKIGDKKEISTIMNNLGVLFKTKGELHKALEYYENSSKLCYEIGNKDDIATSLNNIGNVYRLQGELEKALENYKQSLNYWEEFGNIQFISLSLCNIGEIYQQKGDFDTAVYYFKKALNLREEIGNKQEIALNLFYLISVSLDAKEKRRAERYFNRLKEINGLDVDKIVFQIYRLAEAMILKTSNRMRDKVQAQELLREIIEEEIVDHSLTVLSLLNLCELLIEELKITGEKEILEIIKTIVSSLDEIAKKQKSYDLLVKINWFKSQLALIDLDLNKARELLSDAQYIAEKKGLRRLAMNISSDHDELLNQLSEWEELISKNASLKDRLEFAQLGELVIKQMKRREVDIPEITNEEPIMLLILAESGTPLFTKNYLEGSELDGILIGGFLAAIISFSKETFSSEGSIERIKHQEYTLLLKPKQKFLFSYVIKGQSYSALQKLEAFTKIISTSTSVWDDLNDVLKTSKTITPASRTMLDEIAKMIFPSKF